MFMQTHNIRDYGILQDYWRGELRAMVRPGTKLIFWGSRLATGCQDTVQVTDLYQNLKKWS